jgi:hypothetical protein
MQMAIFTAEKSLIVYENIEENHNSFNRCIDQHKWTVKVSFKKSV